MPTIDLNSDLGENEPDRVVSDDAAMLRVVTSANVSCGFHAGTPEGIRSTLAAAVAAGVTIGAHPGYRDPEGFGRRPMEVDSATLQAHVEYQLGALDALARAVGGAVAYVKPHGALYNAIARDERQAKDVVAAIRAINTMPREDLQMEDWKITPETVREWERMGRARGQEHRMALVVEESTGASAAFTELFFDPRVPSILHQGGTAMIQKHRGKGIGKWVKARMAQRVLDDLPDARYIRTDNAGTNAAMLAINVAMGFRPVWESVIWQIPLEDARRFVR